MQELKIKLCSNNEAIQIHNITWTTQKRIIEFQSDFKDSFHNKNEIKNIPVKVNLQKRAQRLQRKARPIPIHLQHQVTQELKRLIKKANLETVQQSLAFVL